MIGPPVQAPPRQRMQLLAWTPVGKGALLGRAKIQLPNGLQINDVGLFQREDGTRWAQLPSEIMRDAEGQPLKDDRGKIRYRRPIRWSSRDLQNRFSEALFELVESSAGGTAEPHHEAASGRQHSIPGLKASPQRRHGFYTHPRRPSVGPDVPEDDTDGLWRELVP